ncbi:MAG: M20/M25/M40 family metallo-hydrolase, partial [Myxococcales bacterium]|nr:M20/M25/M40 family metallo-hydrolase [Myxococcales bacterium]
MQTLDEALAWLKQQQAAMERDLAELVEISSHTYDLDGVSQSAERIVAQFSALTGDALQGGLVPSTSGKHGTHVALRTGGDGAVLLVGHHDTVFPKASFAGFREDGALLRGPGVLDMKGGLVVIAYALGALHQAGLL